MHTNSHRTKCSAGGPGGPLPGDHWGPIGSGAVRCRTVPDGAGRCWTVPDGADGADGADGGGWPAVRNIRSRNPHAALLMLRVTHPLCTLHLHLRCQLCTGSALGSAPSDDSWYEGSTYSRQRGRPTLQKPEKTAPSPASAGTRAPLRCSSSAAGTEQAWAALP